MDSSLIVPTHIAIIPNGNRTWSKEKGLAAWQGYWQAYKNFTLMYSEVLKIGIDHLTLWGFSTENWKRDSKASEEIFKIVTKVIKKIGPILIEQKIGFHHFGRIDRIPELLIQSIEKLTKQTKEFKRKSFNIALDYGGRDEIIRAINTLLSEGKKDISEQEFSHYLDTADLPDPDLIIRTAGEKRLSGFMPWQSTYAEYYFSEVQFPEFNTFELQKAIADFQSRKRTFGGDIDVHKK
jgi:undecaprenyl diphosphate synthase